MRNIAIAAAVAAALPTLGAAAASGPADPAAAVPAPGYRSAFEGLPRGIGQDQVDWKKANAQVAAFPRGHADYLQWEQQHGAAPAAPAGSAPASAPAAPARGGHQHHGQRRP